MGLARQEHWSGRPFPSPGDLSNSLTGKSELIETHSLYLFGFGFIFLIPEAEDRRNSCFNVNTFIIGVCICVKGVWVLRMQHLEAE